MLPTLVATVAVAWIAAFLTRTRKPAGLDNASWQIYSRYCGARDRLALFALGVTTLALLIGILSIHHPMSAEARANSPACDESPAGQATTCFVRNDQHGWDKWQRKPDGSGQWRLVSTIPPVTHDP